MSELPLDLQHPGGFVEITMNYINGCATCPQPLFSLGGSLSLAGLLYGRRVQSETGNGTNLFVECVGYTSSGKDHPLKSVERIIDSCNATNLRLAQVTSDSAIEIALKEQPRRLATIDEAGYFFSNAAEAKGSPARTIKPQLLSLWSSANSRWIGKQRVPRDGKSVQPPVIIDNPHFSFLGNSQPQIMFENITRADLRDGWLARNLWFISELRPMPIPKPIPKVPNAIMAEVLAYKNDLAVPEIIIVPSDPLARMVFFEFEKSVYEKMLASDKLGDETNYLYGKAGENARRIALILAVSKTEQQPLKAVITEQDAIYATTLVDFLIGNVIRCVDESLAENAAEKAKKRICGIIGKTRGTGITRNELTRKTQFLENSRQRNDYINDLIEGGQVVRVSIDSDANHGEKFVLAGFTTKKTAS